MRYNNSIHQASLGKFERTFVIAELPPLYPQTSINSLKRVFLWIQKPADMKSAG